ncbi:MAG: hypothetical protein ACXVW2_09770 [Nocardioidaceae bacterium]
MSPTQQRKSTTSVPRPRRSAEKTTTRARKGAETTEKAEKADSGMVLPIVNARMPALPRPRLGLPSASGVPGRVLWLGGLGTLAVVGALDWPVAVAIAAGTWVAEQRARERLQAEEAARA